MAAANEKQNHQPIDPEQYYTIEELADRWGLIKRTFVVNVLERGCRSVRLSREICIIKGQWAHDFLSDEERRQRDEEHRE